MSNVIENLEGEIWKDIIGFEGKYAVSNKGRVKSLEFKRKCGKNGSYTNKEKILSFYVNNTGYYKITLLKNKNKIYPYIHRLVAESFIKNTLNKPCVNHIDGNKLNNYVSNLEWVTFSENSEHMYKVLNVQNSKSNLGILGERNPNSKKVLQLTTDGALVKEHPCLRELEREWKGEQRLFRRIVSLCCKGEIENYLGFVWRFKENKDLYQTGSKTPVLQYNGSGEMINSFDSIPEASRKTKVGKRSILSSCKGETLTAGGFFWKFKNK